MKTLGIIFSNIHDKEVSELTASRTLASVPYAGRYRLIDFVLSNMVNSGIYNVGVITKYNYQSLMEHVGSGKSWDLSRKNGGLVILPPYGRESSTVYSSRFEAISNIAYYLREATETYVLMSDCDNVCNVDFWRQSTTTSKSTPTSPSFTTRRIWGCATKKCALPSRSTAAAE